jgi:hypothetical protein
MSKHYQHIFYKFNPEQFEDIIKWAKENSFDIKLTELKSDSWARQQADWDLDYFLSQRGKDLFQHDVIVHRRGFEDWKGSEYFKHNWCIEIGSVVGNLYCSIYVREDKLGELINKFNLEER